KVTIEGSLLTNGTQNNVIQTPTPKNVSILGGKGNIMLATRESTLIGGSGNKTIASQSFIGGGESNVITGNYSRNAVILGGKGNTIIGGASIILGGERNTISGNNSVTLGNNISITGDTSLAAGSGVQLEAAQSFVWNEGTKKFSVTGNNVFALNATRGMIVNTPTPHLQATLTLNGDLRVQTG
ncbi:MAG: hypothetical protein LBG59_07615, partial [Candidatus Peribacteria bacterium]|nr:hypothetical protein [Candidatus Peribacteria bacterium]